MGSGRSARTRSGQSPSVIVMPSIKEHKDVKCPHCDWLAVFHCLKCAVKVCAKHRSVHYPHREIEVEEPSLEPKKGGKK